MDKMLTQPSLFVYHGSQKQNLTEITPHHGVVYAATDKMIAALFMMRRGPWTFLRTIGRYNNREPFFVERYESAFDDFYDGVSGSIYLLDANCFNESVYEGEYLISKETQPVIKEIKIDNVKEFLSQAEKNKEIKIYRYPNRPLCVSQDDSDLIRRIKSCSSGDLQKRMLQELKSLLPLVYQQYKKELDSIQEIQSV